MRKALVLILIAGEVLEESAAESLRQTKRLRDEASLGPDALAVSDRKEWRMPTAPHTFWESLLRSTSHMSSDIGFRLLPEVSLTKLGSSSAMLSERVVEKLRPGQLSYLIPRKEIPETTSDPVDVNAAHLQMAVAKFCILFAVVGYILCYACLLVWWCTHPFKHDDLTSDDDISEKKNWIAHLGATDLLRRLSAPRGDPEAQNRDISESTMKSSSSIAEDADEDEARARESPERDRYHHGSDLGMVDHKRKASITPNIVSFKSRMSVWEDDHIEIRSDELVDAIGISALCMFPADHGDGVERLPNSIAVPLLFVQAAGLQLCLMYFMWLQLLPRVYVERPLPLVLIFVAIYLHFLNCVQELPYAIQIFRYFVDFHDSLAEVVCFGFVLIADAFVIPAVCFILGALYLCTSTTVADCILNAVAVAFVREIDNWIIGFLLKISLLGGKVQSEMVQFPVGASSMRVLSLSFVYFPLVPALFSIGCLWVGVALLKL